jgi:hypothetical protein
MENNYQKADFFMRKFLIFLLALVAFTAFDCGNKSKKSSGDNDMGMTQNKNVEIIFREYEHAFGKVAEGEKVAFVFSFENKGTEDLVIKSAVTTCGCTVPEYDTKPVPPGGEGKLEVEFNTSGRSGMQTKTITVKSNASVPEVILKITAEVVNSIN